MAAFNPRTREVAFKIVYYGPGLGGKTTNLQYIHRSSDPAQRSNLVSLATPTERTLYFDFLPVRLAKLRGMNVRLQLFTVPGQVYFSATRKLVLTGADGLVFVADSQSARMDANQESLEDLNGNLAEHGKSLSQMPHAFQWNKRDLPAIVPEDELDRRFNLFGAPALGTVATNGVGVYEGLEAITRRIIDVFRTELPRGEKLVPGLLDAEELGLEEAIRSLAAIPAAAPLSPPPMDDDAPAEREVALRAVTTPSAPHVASVVPARGALTPTVAAMHTSLFSMAELWPPSDRDAVRRVEAFLSAGDARAAVLACELVVSRELEVAASFDRDSAVTRDPALVALLLGADGRHYLAFREAVRTAGENGEITQRDAVEAYLFAIELHRRRDGI